GADRRFVKTFRVVMERVADDARSQPPLCACQPCAKMTRGLPGTACFSPYSPHMHPSASCIRSLLRRDAASSACFGAVGPARFVKSLAIFSLLAQCGGLTG